jgi:hypothetical protein
MRQLQWTVLLIVAALAVAAAQQPTFRAGVTLVSTDVIARDQDGRFVADLTRENFTVLEDGVAQTISSFTLIRGGRTYNLLQPNAPAAEPDGLVLPQAKPRTDDTSGRVLLVFIDDLHFEPEYSPHVRKLMETIVDTLVHDGDLVMVVSSGPSYLEIGPTYDKKMVREAVGKIRGSGLLPAELFKMLESSQGPGDIRDRARMAFFTAYKLLGDMERDQQQAQSGDLREHGLRFRSVRRGRLGRDRIQGGRFSDPMRYLIDTENPYFRLGSVTADIDLHALMRELVLSANRANATFYTIDPRGLTGVVDAGQYLDQSEWRTYLQKTASTLRFLAEGTGGFAVVNTNDFAGELKRIDAETSDYYVLGFYSSNPDPAKRTRTLEVKVDRPNVAINSRQAYSLKTEGKAPAPPPLKIKK